MEYCRKEIVRNMALKGDQYHSWWKGKAGFHIQWPTGPNENTDIVLTHDGARPFVKVEHIEDGIKGVGTWCNRVPVKDTIKVVGDSE